MAWTAPIAPVSEDTVYLVVDNLYEHGKVWREAPYGGTDLDAVIQDIVDAQYNDPFRVIAFNTDEKWSKDVSADVAAEVRRHFERSDEDVPAFLRPFVEHYTGRTRQLSLRFA